MSFRNNQLEQWNLRFQEMIDFKAEHGHCLVPLQYEKNPSLAHWVKRQRNQYQMKKEGKHSTMTNEREASLERLGFVWDSHAAVWEERLGELRRFRDVFGHCRVPKRKTKLSVWVKCQRRQFKLYSEGKESNMTPQRVAKLNALGFDFFPRANKQQQQTSSITSSTVAAISNISNAANGASAAVAPGHCPSAAALVAASRNASSFGNNGLGKRPCPPFQVSESEHETIPNENGSNSKRPRKTKEDNTSSTRKTGVLPATSFIPPSLVASSSASATASAAEQAKNGLFNGPSISSIFTAGCQQPPHQQGLQQQLQQQQQAQILRQQQNAPTNMGYHQQTASLQPATASGRFGGGGAGACPGSAAGGGPLSFVGSPELQQILSLLTQQQQQQQQGSTTAAAVPSHSGADDGGATNNHSAINSHSIIQELLKGNVTNNTNFNPAIPPQAFGTTPSSNGGVQATAVAPQQSQPAAAATTGQLGLALLGLSLIMNDTNTTTTNTNNEASSALHGGGVGGVVGGGIAGAGTDSSPIGSILSEILKLSSSTSTLTAAPPPTPQPQQNHQQHQDPLLAALLQQQQQQQAPMQQQQAQRQQNPQQMMGNPSGSSQEVMDQIKEQYINMAAASLVANSLGSSTSSPPLAAPSAPAPQAASISATNNNQADLSSILLGALAQASGTTAATTSMPTIQQQQPQQQQQSQQQQQISPEILNLLLSARR